MLTDGSPYPNDTTTGTISTYHASTPAMIFPSFDRFSQLANQDEGKFQFIPVYQEWVADLDTPVSAWYKVCAGQPYSFLTESVEGGETVGRYSMLGCDPLWVLENRGAETTQTHRDGTVTKFTGDPFLTLDTCLETYRDRVAKLPQLPNVIGSLFGFWGYESMKWIESRVPIHPATAEDVPDGLWMQIDRLIIFDRVKRKIWAIAYADVSSGDLELAYTQAADRVKAIIEKLQQPITSKRLEWTPPQPSPALTELPAEYTSNTSKAEFCANVDKAKAYITAGDIFQVVISQCLSTDYTGDPFELYRSLSLVNPSPYMAYFNFGDWQIIGSSPEVMVRADRNLDRTLKATVRPIAGTRRRGQTPLEDDALALELIADPKEVAEHVMLVDLGRNDLGRVCESGTVVVDKLMTIERYSHVMHIVSNVVGKLAANQTASDLLKACFPAGTVSGAPKIRALEIVYELEGCRRNAYSGIYGYYDFEGQLNTAITLRTMIVRPDGNNHIVSVQAGAGLVADSDPVTEYEETLNKARGLLEAIRCLSQDI
jgi:anthranilate synthase component I